LWLVDCSGGELTEIQRWKTPRGGAIGPALKSGNLDRDAESELLVGTNGGEIYVLEFDQQGNARIVGSAKAGRLAYGVNAADIDGDGIDEFISSRGRIGYATMTQEDVAVEVWKPAPGKALKRIWSRLTVGNPRTQVHDIDGDGTTEILVYSDYGTGTKIDVLTIQSSPR
jgi:hypothetical protein